MAFQNFGEILSRFISYLFSSLTIQIYVLTQLILVMVFLLFLHFLHIYTLKCFTLYIGLHSYIYTLIIIDYCVVLSCNICTHV